MFSVAQIYLPIKLNITITSISMSRISSSFKRHRYANNVYIINCLNYPKSSSKTCTSQQSGFALHTLTVELLHVSLALFSLRIAGCQRSYSLSTLNCKILNGWDFLKISITNKSHVLIVEANRSDFIYFLSHVTFIPSSKINQVV